VDEAANDQWWLVAHVPATRPGTKSDLDILRQVSGDELAEARRANDLLNRLAAAAPYARLVDLFGQLEAALGRLGGKRATSPERVTAELNRAAVALGKAAVDVPEEVLRRAREDFTDGSDELAAIEEAVAEESARAPFRLLVAVGKLNRGGFAAVGDGVGNDTEAIAALRGEVAEVTEDVDLVSTMRGGVIVAQRLIGRQLQVYEDRIRDATLILRQLAVEVLDGAPSLMRGDVDTSQGIKLGPVSFETLALEHSVTLLHALRHAHFLLEATSGGIERRQGQAAYGADESEAAATAPATEEADAATPLAAPSGEPIEVEELPAPSAAPDAAPTSTDGRTSDGGDEGEAVSQPEADAAPSGKREDQVLDFGALVAHALNFTDELERAWSRALDPKALGAAQFEFEARLASLLRTFERRVSASARQLRDAGFDTTVPAYPMPASAYGEVSFDPDPERHWLQLQLAQFDALIALLAALETMRAPSARRVELPSGQTEIWWEAGAFDLIRTRARGLLRIVAAADAAEDALLGKEDAAAPAGAVFERLELLRGAIDRNDVEAALLHAERALRLRAGLDGRPVPADLLERIATDQRLGDEAVLIRLLDEAVRRIHEGRPLDLGAAAVIAAPVARLVASLCIERPEIVTGTLGAEAGERPSEEGPSGQ
jgi:hypothetical protein